MSRSAAHRQRHLRLCLATSLVVLAACGGGGEREVAGGAAPEPAAAEPGYGVQVANYDLAMGSPQRVLVGLFSKDGGVIVGGQIEVAFRYLGATPPTSLPVPDGQPDIAGVVGTSLTVAGGTAPPEGGGPRVREPSDGMGVYETEAVSFDQAGYWALTVDATVGGDSVEASGAFEVHERNQIVTVGQSAPRTVNPLLPAEGTPAEAIDSRAEAGEAVPDPELHAQTVAESIATGKPTLVVVSTPVFCVSRFCGPITDTVQAMAQRYGDRAGFVHLEVWQDFDAKAINSAAAEWIFPNPAVEPAEPWVFLIDGSGTVVARWDNVTNEARLTAALDGLLS